MELQEASSTNIIQEIRSRRMGWAGIVARMREGAVHTACGLENMREVDHLQNLCVSGNIILKWIFRK